MRQFLIRWRWLLVAILLFGNLLVWSVIFRASGKILTVYFLDVGQGDAILIAAPNGNQVLIDGGPGRKILSELGQVLPFYDRSLDLIIATHPDSDHIGGLPLVFQNYNVTGFIEPGIICNTATCRALGEVVAAEPAQKMLATRGMKIDLGRGAALEILSPSAGASNSKDTNAASIVAKLTYGATSFLFTGDASQAIERQLVVREGENLDVDGLKVGHHGSDTSSSPEFLAATSPAMAVISVGKDNRYGHPKAEVLERLEKTGAKILRTDESGRIKFTSDGSSFSPL